MNIYRFILKTIFFTGPFFGVYVAVLIFHHLNSGDLTRVGLLMHKTGYREIFSDKYEFEHQQSNFKSFTIPAKPKEDNGKIRVLTIGDSFSNQGGVGYNSFLGSKDSIEVTNYSGGLNINKNPYQTLYYLSKTDMLKGYDFIILESVERLAVSRIPFDTNLEINFDSLFQDHKAADETLQAERLELFNNKVLKVPLVSILYNFVDNPMDSKAFIFQTSCNLFSGKPSELLVSKEDIDYLEKNNNPENIEVLNDFLNELTNTLKDQGVNLIYLVCPDKYGVYYNYMIDNSYPAPLFFDEYQSQSKQYMYFNTQKLLRGAVNAEKDLYYYDDTHWSPIAAEMISDELEILIKHNFK